MPGWRCFLCLGLLLAPLSGFCGTLAQFRTIFGDIEAELYDQDKPVTVQNFIRYVQSGAYQNGFAHRLVPGFVVQGGGFTVTNRGATNWQALSVATFPPIINEFSVGRRFSNVYGTIAMAKVGGNTNSATSQWFFNLVNNTFLDAANTNNLFVVFGHVIGGTNVLNKLNSFQVFNGTQTSNLVAHQIYQPPFDDLPLLRPVLNDTNFVFMDVSLLQVGIATNSQGGQQISWNSATGKTNVVEFTTNLPPSWYTLIRTNGTGNRMSVSDTGPAGLRFYRVRVE
jgi:cyclophilin family peptidyl-prolyl cis-trans isomerase